jgi:membrane protein implicated in regulation of membrane protease activity
VALLIGGTLAYLFLPFPWWVVVVVALAAVEVFEIQLWLSLRGRRPLAGAEGLVGERGVLAGPDRVRIRGTSYRARGVDGDAGEPVVVEAVEGMTLVVRRAGDETP